MRDHAIARWSCKKGSRLARGVAGESLFGSPVHRARRKATNGHPRGEAAAAVAVQLIPGLLIPSQSCDILLTWGKQGWTWASATGLKDKHTCHCLSLTPLHGSCLGAVCLQLLPWPRRGKKDDDGGGRSNFRSRRQSANPGECGKHTAHKMADDA